MDRTGSTVRGVYEAKRASALAGVPVSTLYEWARDELIVPSVSAEKLKLWSWTDLVAARAVYWLRHPRGASRPATAMARAKELLEHLKERSEDFGEGLASGGVGLRVDPAGTPHLLLDGLIVEAKSSWRQRVAEPLVVQLLEAFSLDEGIVGPDLLQPAASLRIIPGKLAGEPHVEGTRVETRVLAALYARGYREPALAAMYPGISRIAVRDAIRLERRLERNLSKAAA